MTDPLAPVTAGRGRGLSFSLGGIPVTINLSLLLVLAFLGFQLGDFALIVVFVIVGTVSVLVHELGHAVAARLAGFSPKVELAGMGGVTSYRGDTSRLTGLAITAAGPVVQILAGVAAMAFTDGFGLVYGGDLVAFGVSAWVVISIVWGALNLVPVLPLDGGQLMQGLIPGSLRTRSLVAHGVSAAVAIAGLLWALATAETWIALLAGFFAWTNTMALLALRSEATTSAAAGQVSGQPTGQPTDQPTATGLLTEGRKRLEAGDTSGWQLVRAATLAPGPLAIRSVAATMVVTALLRAGEYRRAYQVVADPRPGIPIDEVVVARTLSTHPNQVGVRRAVLTWAHERNDARARGIAALLLALGGDIDTADRWVAVGPVAPSITEAIDAQRQAPHPPG